MYNLPKVTLQIMARPAFKPGYSVSRIYAFIHSAFEIFYNILKRLIDMQELDSVVFLKKPSLLHYIQNLTLKFYIGFLPHKKMKGVGKHEEMSELLYFFT